MTEHDQVVADEFVGETAAEPDAASETTQPPATGDARVDAAIGVLPALADQPVAEHIETYEDVHRQLHEALADLDGIPGSPRGGS